MVEGFLNVSVTILGRRKDFLRGGAGFEPGLEKEGRGMPDLVRRRNEAGGSVEKRSRPPSKRRGLRRTKGSGRGFLLTVP